MASSVVMAGSGSVSAAGGSSHLGADSLDFHPGLRVAYVEYCKVPVGQGRLAFDAAAPKLSQAQFLKLMQDIGVVEPEGARRACRHPPQHCSARAPPRAPAALASAPSCTALRALACVARP